MPKKKGYKKRRRKTIPRARIRKIIIRAHKKGFYGNREVWEYVKKNLSLKYFEAYETAYQVMKNYTEDLNMEID